MTQIATASSEPEFQAPVRGMIYPLSDFAKSFLSGPKEHGREEWIHGEYEVLDGGGNVIKDPKNKVLTLEFGYVSVAGMDLTVGRLRGQMKPIARLSELVGGSKVTAVRRVDSVEMKEDASNIRSPIVRLKQPKVRRDTKEEQDDLIKTRIRDRVIAFLLDTGNTLETIEILLSTGDYGRPLPESGLAARIKLQGGKKAFASSNSYMNLPIDLLNLLTNLAHEVQPEKIFTEDQPEAAKSSQEASLAKRRGRYRPEMFDGRWNEESFLLLAHMKASGVRDDIAGRAVSAALFGTDRLPLSYSEAGSVANRLFAGDPDSYIVEYSPPKNDVEVDERLLEWAMTIARELSARGAELNQSSTRGEVKKAMSREEWVVQQSTRLIDSLHMRDSRKTPPMTSIVFYRKQDIPATSITIHVPSENEVKEEQRFGEYVIPDKRNVQLELLTWIQRELAKLALGEKSSFNELASVNSGYGRIELYRAEYKKGFGITRSLVSVYTRQ